MTIDSIKNGIVIDHITAGNAMKLYQLLNLDRLDCPVAVMQKVHSNKMGEKDIIKIDGEVDLNMDILGYVDPKATVDIIRDGVLKDKYSIAPPETLRDVIFCKNPRCITTTEQELPHIFKLTDCEHHVYRCIYCEAKAK